jgi:hypothetical protein
MNTFALSPSASPLSRRIVGVVVDAQTYRNIAYLLAGLPLGIAWLAVLVSGVAVGASLVVVALVGIPLLLAMWYMVRAAANAERAVADRLLGGRRPLAPWSPPYHGNPWVRLRAMSAEPDRWRELRFLLARFPVGVATFTVAVTALATSAAVAFSPIACRLDNDREFGSWKYSTTVERFADSAWSWLMLPLGLVMMLTALHGLNAIARACGRWTTRALTPVHGAPVNA